MKLKTLKDLRGLTDRYVDLGGNPLTDDKGDFITTRMINEDELKAEAIKWVKQHRTMKPNFAKMTNEEIFMEFHNITEEDLK